MNVSFVYTPLRLRPYTMRGRRLLGKEGLNLQRVKLVSADPQRLSRLNHSLAVIRWLPVSCHCSCHSKEAASTLLA